MCELWRELHCIGSHHELQRQFGVVFFHPPVAYGEKIAPMATQAEPIHNKAPSITNALLAFSFFLETADIYCTPKY